MWYGGLQNKLFLIGSAGQLNEIPVQTLISLIQGHQVKWALGTQGKGIPVVIGEASEEQRLVSFDMRHFLLFIGNK